MWFTPETIWGWYKKCPKWFQYTGISLLIIFLMVAAAAIWLFLSRMLSTDYDTADSETAGDAISVIEKRYDKNVKNALRKSEKNRIKIEKEKTKRKTNKEKREREYESFKEKKKRIDDVSDIDDIFDIYNENRNKRIKKRKKSKT